MKGGEGRELDRERCVQARRCRQERRQGWCERAWQRSIATKTRPCDCDASPREGTPAAAPQLRRVCSEEARADLPCLAGAESVSLALCASVMIALRALTPRRGRVSLGTYRQLVEGFSWPEVSAMFTSVGAACSGHDMLMGLQRVSISEAHRGPGSTRR